MYLPHFSQHHTELWNLVTLDSHFLILAPSFPSISSAVGSIKHDAVGHDFDLILCLSNGLSLAFHNLSVLGFGLGTFDMILSSFVILNIIEKEHMNFLIAKMWAKNIFLIPPVI